MRLLLVEDDRTLGKSIQRGLSESGHECVWAHDGADALANIAEGAFDAIVLDLMLPDVPGLELLARLRSEHNTTPVLILTALGSVDERVAGLNSGADDYLVKPFAFPELVARLEAICRRASASSKPVLTEGPVTLDLQLRKAVRNGRELDLTPTEFALLEFLMRHANQVVTRRMLCEHLWDASWEGVTNVIEVHINRLRSKLDRGFDKPVIHTVRGLGYAFRTPT